jgi:hypothetical protein
MNGHEIHCKRRSQYVSKVSSIGYKKQGGPSTEPCGTPLCTLTGRLYDSPTLTQKVRSLKKALIHANRFPVIPRCCNLEINRRLGTRSKAFEKSKYAVSGCLNSCCDGVTKSWPVTAPGSQGVFRGRGRGFGF